jgi:REP-associated tyrosine transposase
MSQSLSQIYLHAVFGTKHRYPWITSSIEEDVYRYISGICKGLKCPVHKIGGMEDHIHILFELSKTESPMDVVKKIKANSSKWIKKKHPTCEKFSWQKGYGVYSVGQSTYKSVSRYIENQKEHHKKISFQDEFENMLKAAGLSFDPKYLWD